MADETYLQNPEVELGVLSTLYYDEQLQEHIGRFFPSLFTGMRMPIFKAMKHAYKNKIPINKMYLMQRLGEYGYSPVQCEIHLKTLDVDKMTSIGTLMWYEKRLRELYFYRTVRKISDEITAASLEGSTAKIIRKSDTIRKLYGAMNNHEAKDHLEDLVERVNDEDEYIPTPLTRLSQLIGGFTRKDISSIGGKSGHNKTTFSLHLAMEAIKAGMVNKILFVSVDEPGEMIMRRMLASEGDISTTAMRNKEVKLDYNEAKRVLAPLLKHLIIIDNVFSPEEIKEAIMDFKPDQAIIDHVQELRFPGEDGISESGITLSLKLFKEAARLINANVMVLSQVRDKLIDERFEDREPKPHDFYYASTIRQKSREQCTVYWRYNDYFEDADFNVFKFTIWKSTYSSKGVIKFSYEPEYARFKELTKFEEHKESSSNVWTTLNNKFGKGKE